MRHTEPTRDQQLQPISNTAVLPPKTSGNLRALFPCFQHKPGCGCTSKLPSGIASAKSCSAHFQPFPKGCIPCQSQRKTLPSSTASPARPNLSGKWNDSSRSSKSSGCPSGALQHLPKVQLSNMEQQQKSGKHLENDFFRNSTGGDVPTPCHTHGGTQEG